MPPKKGAALAAPASLKRKASSDSQPVVKRQLQIGDAFASQIASSNGDSSLSDNSSSGVANSPPLGSPGASQASASSTVASLSQEASVGSSGSQAPIQTNKGSPTQKKHDAAEAINAAKPKPFGKPPVFAEARQALCESLPYFQAYQSSAYTKDGRAWAVLLDFTEDSNAHMDEEVIVHKTGGGCKIAADASREQIKDHHRTDHIVQAFLENWARDAPLVVIAGSRNTHCPTAMPHRYNVLDWFIVTHVWPELNGDKVAFKVRVQKLDLTVKSWWALGDSPMPSQERDFTTRALRQSCHHCRESSTQVYAKGWMCLNEKCGDFFKIDGNKVTERRLNPTFLSERFTQERKPPMPLLPQPLEDDPKNELQWLSRAAWKGVPCARCGACIAGKDWHFWKCETENCGWTYSLKHPALSYKLFQINGGLGYEGHAPTFNQCRYPFKEEKYQIHGNWVVNTYNVMPGNYIIHMQANRYLNAELGGANEIFDGLANDREIPFQRNKMEGSHVVEGGMYTKHFAVNYGAQYKYVAKVGMLPFTEAPKVIKKALGRITWACTFALKLLHVTDYEKPNELLAVGYKEGNDMGYHDDGETGLGITVGSLSLGGEADFAFRMKDKLWSPTFMNDPQKYQPDQMVLEGSKLWKERRALNAKHGKISEAKFQVETQKLYTQWKAFHLSRVKEARGKECPTLLNLKLKHGDFVIMHGAEIQTFFEHSAKPNTNMRFALTARTIDPDLAKVPEDKRAHGLFTLADDEIYNPDLSS